MPRIIITEPEKNPQPYRFDLDADAVKIGRAETCEIQLTCGSISSLHAEMARVPGGFELRDLQSTNGISKDEEAVESWMLANGDLLMLGDVAFNFELSEDEMTALAGEVSGSKKHLPDLPEKNPDKPTAAPHVALNPVVAGSRESRESRGPSGWWLVLAFLVLGTASFYFGLSLRHKNETGSTIGEVMRKKLSQPDVSRLATSDPELHGELFVKPSEEEEEIDIEVAPPADDEVPAEIEESEESEQPNDSEETAETPAFNWPETGQDATDDSEPETESIPNPFE